MVFYDIHTHKSSEKKDVITVKSVDLGTIGDVIFAKEEIKNRKRELFSVGIHPWHPDKDKIPELKELAALENVVAIGEAGLDKLKPDFELQKQLFESQIQIAEAIGKPLIIHCIRAWNELLEIRKRWNPSNTWIIHGFRGKPSLCAQLIESGLYLSFGSRFHSESLKKAWAAKRLFVETDNSDDDIRDTYSKIATVFSIPVNELSEEITTFVRFLK